MERICKQSGWWRAFALLLPILLLVLSWAKPVESGFGLNWFTVKTVYWSTALLGLLGYAYGFRLLSVTFWRFYATIFTIEMVLRSLRMAWIPVARAGGWPEESRHGTGIIIFVLLVTAIVCVALLRHAELLSGGRQSPSNYRTIFS